MPDLSQPFRADDVGTRIEVLRTRRDELASQLSHVEAQLKLLRPWSWGRFLLGLLLPPGAFLAVILVVAVFPR